MKDMNGSSRNSSGLMGLTAISVLSLLGMGANIYLSIHYYAVRTGSAGFKSACNLGSAMNCDAVAASPYAELIGGIPLSSFGVAWFLAMLIVSLLARGAEWRREGVRALFAMAGFSMLLSIGYLFVMATVIKTYCLFCLGVDVISFLSFAVALGLKPEGTSKSPLDFARWKTVAGITAASLVVSLVFLSTLDEGRIPRNQLEERVDSALNSPVLAVGTGEEFPSIGPKDAAVTIVEFSDFQCPYCRIGALNLNAVMNRYPTQVRVVFRNFPLDSACNRAMERSMHPVACDAAKVAFCAHKQGEFAAVYEALFDHQEKLGPSEGKRPEDFAKETGLDYNELKACMGSPEIANAVARDIDEGTRLGVASTPTFFINGRKVEGAYPVTAWNLMVERLLKK